jgi:DNA repair protein RadD
VNYQPQTVQARWYQEAAIDSLFSYFEHNNGNPLVCMPTGSGKGFVIAKFINLVFSLFPYQRILMATHVKELIEQNARKMLEVWPLAPIGIYSAGLRQKELTAPITFAGIASIVNAVKVLGHYDLFLIDEAHLLGPNDDSQYGKVIAALLAVNPRMKIIGFTATGWRTGMGRLTNGPIFTDTCFDICNIEGFSRLFADYHLVPPRPRRVNNVIDTSGVCIQNGDFAQGQLSNKADEKITWKLIGEALDHGKDRTTRLMFCAGVERAIMSAEMLRAYGLNAHAVHSKMNGSKERDDIMLAFRAGEVDTLCLNGIGTTGLDVPRIDHIICARPTMSVGLHVQMIGRGMRPYEVNGWQKRDCLVSDHAGNVRRLGPVDDPVIPKMKGKGTGEAPVKICPACDCYCHAAARVCPFCGEIFDAKFEVKVKAYDDELIRSDLPIIEWFNVTGGVYYTLHTKKNQFPPAAPIIKASYSCGLRTFIEWITVEHSSPFMKKRFSDWWRQRFVDQTIPIPSTASECVQYFDKLVPPKRVQVWVNKKYPEITGCEF